MISDKGRAMLDAGYGCYMVAAATGDPYMELAEYVSQNHPDENSPDPHVAVRMATRQPGTARDPVGEDRTMNRIQFIEGYLPAVHARMVQLSKTKGQEYAGSDDALANFRRIGAQLGLPPQVVLWVYLGKHIDAIASYVRNGHVLSEEPITGRIDDAILYLILLRLLVDDTGEGQAG